MASKKHSEFEDELKKFYTTINGIRSYVPDFYKAHLQRISNNNKKKKELEKKKIVISKDGNLFVKSENLQEFEELIESIGQTKEIGGLILPSQYVTLFLVFESYIRQIIRLTLSAKKEILKETEKNISLSEVLEFDNINDAIFYSIEQEVDEALRNKNSILDWIKTNLKIEIPDIGNLNKNFTRYNSIRNLIVHNNGIVNKHYIKKCLEAKVDKKDLPKIGEHIKITPELFGQTATTLYLVGFRVGINLWQYSKPQEIRMIENLVIDQQLNFLNRKAYKTLEILSDMVLSSIKVFSSKNSEYNILINKAISLKFKKDEIEMEKIFKIIPMKDKTFNLAIALIRKDFETASDLMKKINKSKLQYYYRVWPLFKLNHNSKIINKTYKRIIGKLTKVPEKQMRLASKSKT